MLFVSFILEVSLMTLRKHLQAELTRVSRALERANKRRAPYDLSKIAGARSGLSIICAHLEIAVGSGRRLHEDWLAVQKREMALFLADDLRQRDDPRDNAFFHQRGAIFLAYLRRLEKLDG